MIGTRPGEDDGSIKELSKKEQARLDREMKHLFQNLEGIENMTQLPDAMFVIDSNAEEIAVKEARRMGVPVVSVVDTNCDPDVVDWIIPGNDDALRAIRLFTSKISESVLEGHTAYQQSQVADRSRRRIRPWSTASNTWTPVSTSNTRSRKATSSKAWKSRRLRRNPMPSSRKQQCRPTRQPRTNHRARVGNPETRRCHVTRAPGLVASRRHKFKAIRKRKG